jgi:hypothetical protein
MEPRSIPPRGRIQGPPCADCHGFKRTSLKGQASNNKKRNHCKLYNNLACCSVPGSHGLPPSPLWTLLTACINVPYLPFSGPLPTAHALCCPCQLSHRTASENKLRVMLLSCRLPECYSNLYVLDNVFFPLISAVPLKIAGNKYYVLFLMSYMLKDPVLFGGS